MLWRETLEKFLPALLAWYYSGVSNVVRSQEDIVFEKVLFLWHQYSSSSVTKMPKNKKREYLGISPLLLVAQRFLESNYILVFFWPLLQLSPTLVVLEFG